MSKQQSYTLGLDIGVASVGYGLIDENRNIIDAGVRLFPEANKDDNGDRRSFRGSRRLKRRRKHRLERVKHLLASAELPTETSNDFNTTPYHLRVKGLTEPLSLDELSASLLHLAKRRGIHNVETIEDSDESSPSSLSTKDQLSQNQKKLEEKHVCELQLERLEDGSGVRGHHNRFKTEDYVKEAYALLKNQQKYHENISDSFIESYVELIRKRREYFEGPGYGSPYGWEQDINKWYEQMMGRCSYFPDEFRSVKAAPSAQLYNALNELNNLRLNREENEKLTEEEKRRVIDNIYKKKKSAPTLKQIAKEVNLTEDEISGYRINKNKKPEFTAFTTLYQLKDIIPESSFSEMDEVARILTVWQTPTDKRIELKKKIENLSEEQLDKLSDISFSETHSLSLKAINVVLPVLWEEPKNQMQAFKDLNLKPETIKLKGEKNIPSQHIDEWILSPVVKRSFKQSVRIVNAIIKKYGYPETIVVELARENNSKDRKKFFDKLQRENRALNEKVREKLEKKDLDGSRGHFEKLRLWHKQDGRCMYSTDAIKVEDLLNSPEHYEVDHIIPRSVSFDDSQNNKVLVKLEENQRKGNKTPFQYMGHEQYRKFKSQVLQLAKSPDKLSHKKKNYLLEERNINKYDVQKDFINRNLVDTRYATRELLSLLTNYFRDNELEVKVKSINGGFTHYLRKLWRFDKNREEDHKHHAQDALVVAMADYLFKKNKELNVQGRQLTYGKDVDTDTGEVLNESFDALFTEKIGKVKAIEEYDNYKYSYRVDMKPNRQLMNDTIYSTREFEGDEYVIGKISDIYNKDQADIKKKFDKDPAAFLMYHHDPKTFEKFKLVMERYQEYTNPLAAMYEQEGKMLTKYSKKGNGPPVKSFKIKRDKLKVHKDISHKYTPKNKKVVNLSLKPFRTDVYKENGIYKFVTVLYSDLVEKKNWYVMNEENYKLKLENKKILNGEFLFSLYTGSTFELNGTVGRFIGTNNDNLNRVEYKPLNYYEKERLTPTIGKKTESFSKIHVDILGNQFNNNAEQVKYKYRK